MPFKIKIQKSPRTKRTIDHKNEYPLSQINWRLNKILQQTDTFEFESNEAFNTKYDCSSSSDLIMKWVKENRKW